MSNDPNRARWHRIDPKTAKRLTEASSSPGVVFPVRSDAVPAEFHDIKGVTSYFMSSYTAPVPLTPHLTAGAEVAVVRHDDATAKAYNYIFATSSDGQVYFSGPHKAFAAHHFATSEAVPVQNLFGHPFTKGSR
jgi:hypothetical protein